MKIKTKRILFALFLVFALCATMLSAAAEEADVGETTPPTSEPPIEGVETDEAGTDWRVGKGSHRDIGIRAYGA